MPAPKVDARTTQKFYPKNPYPLIIRIFEFIHFVIILFIAIECFNYSYGTNNTTTISSSSTINFNSFRLFYHCTFITISCIIIGTIFDASKIGIILESIRFFITIIILFIDPSLIIPKQCISTFIILPFYITSLFLLPILKFVL